MQSTREKLRDYYRQLRRQLSFERQQTAAHQLVRHFSQHELFLQSQHIAFYIAHDSEIDPHPFIQYAWQQGKHCYLPVLAPNRLLKFATYTPKTKLHKNRLQIAEPSVASIKLHSAQELDLILMPLLAFDEQGNRLGMGGGYYDRTLAFLNTKDVSQSPYCIGLAYECQKAPRIFSEAWDIPLHGIITEQRFIQVSRI